MENNKKLTSKLKEKVLTILILGALVVGLSFLLSWFPISLLLLLLALFLAWIGSYFLLLGLRMELWIYIILGLMFVGLALFCIYVVFFRIP